jgi:hypothetical protein
VGTRRHHRHVRPAQQVGGLVGDVLRAPRYRFGDPSAVEIHPSSHGSRSQRAQAARIYADLSVTGVPVSAVQPARPGVRLAAARRHLPICREIT